jgi:hypothetical protein
LYQAVRVNRVGGLGATLGSQLGQPGSVRIDIPVRHVECSAIGLADLTDWLEYRPELEKAVKSRDISGINPERFFPDDDFVAAVE